MEPLTLEETWASALVDAAYEWRNKCNRDGKPGAEVVTDARAKASTRFGDSKTPTSTRTSQTCIGITRPS